MKYLKSIWYSTNTYNMYLDDNLDANTNIVQTNSSLLAYPFNDKQMLYLKYISNNNFMVESNKKDLSNSLTSTSGYTINNGYGNNYQLKVVNGLLCRIGRDTIVIINKTDLSFRILNYSDIDYYNGYYYVAYEKTVYRSTDLVNFESVGTLNVSNNIRQFCIIDGTFYWINKYTSGYNITMFSRPLNNLGQNSTTVFDYAQSNYGIVNLSMYKIKNYIVLYSYTSYGGYFSILKYNGVNTFTSVVKTCSSYYHFVTYDAVNENIIMSTSNKQFIYNTNNNDVAEYSLSGVYGIAPMYHTLELSKIGSNFHISSPYGTQDGNNIYYDIDSYENDYYKIYVNADTDYKINSVVSSNGTVTRISDSQYSIDYTNTDLYYTDSISVETEYAIKLLEGNYKMTFNSLTTEFESNESDLDNFAFVNHTIYPFKKMRFLNNKLSVLSGETWIDLMENNTWVENSARYIVLSSELSGLTNQVVNGTQTLSNYYRGIIFNITENDSTYIARFDGLIYHITYDAYLERDVDNYIVIFEDSSDTLQYEFTALDGYKIQSITTNRGTVANNTVTILMSYFYNNMDLNINCITDYNDFGIILYKNNSDTKEMNKVLTNSLSVRGNLIEATSVEHPSIVFELNNGNDDIVPQYNYCYIPNFERYYFVEDKVNVGRNLWRLELRESDVLMSFKDGINALSGLITRNSNTYNDSLIDDLIPKKNELNITETEMNVLEHKGFKADLTNYNNNINYNIVVNVANGLAYNGGAGITITPKNVYANNVLPSLVDTQQYSNGNQTFVFYNYGDYAKFIQFVNNHEGLKSYVLNAYIYPFDLRQDFGSVDHYGIIADGALCYQIGIAQGRNSVILQKGTEPYEENDPILEEGVISVSKVNYYKLASFTINRPANYLDLKAKYELFIPFAGWVTLNGEQVFGKTIEIVYQIDLQTGDNNVCLCDVTSNKLIYTAKCSLGISLPLTFDNSAEIQRQRDNLYITTFLSNLSGASTLAFGVASQNPIAVAGGVMSLGKTWASYFTGMNSLFETAQANMGSGYSASYLPLKPRLRITKEIELYTNNESWRKLYGKPLMVIDTISNYSDYIEAQIEKVNIPNATNEEKNRIKQLFKDGIYKTI